jgi:N-acetylmuramoyl-L-alanine amidase
MPTPCDETTAAPAPRSSSLPRTLGRYAVRYGTTSVALAAASIAASASSAAADETYEVRLGDTVSHIAQRTGATTESIRNANGLDHEYRIREGQLLTIPSASSAPSTASTSVTPPPPSSPATTHRVVAGDTVSGIAARYGTTVAQMISHNGLGADALIRVGQTLSVPSAATAPALQLVGDTFAGRTYSTDVVSAANQNKATLLSMTVPGKDEMRQIVRDTAVAHGVDPALALAVATQESGFDQRAVSPANAIGTMQVIPTSGDWASDIVGRDLNLLDARDNVTAGVAILGRLVATSPTLDAAIAGYYQGQASVRTNGMYDDTRRYVANVQTLAAQNR